MSTPNHLEPAAIVVDRAPLRRAAAVAPRLEATWARSEAEVRAAQRLRYQVFVQEMGAALSPPPR